MGQNNPTPKPGDGGTPQGGDGGKPPKTASDAVRTSTADKVAKILR